jgi:hypothetical protein
MPFDRHPKNSIRGSNPGGEWAIRELTFENAGVDISEADFWQAGFSPRSDVASLQGAGRFRHTLPAVSAHLSSQVDGGDKRSGSAPTLKVTEPIHREPLPCVDDREVSRNRAYGFRNLDVISRDLNRRREGFGFLVGHITFP